MIGTRIINLTWANFLSWQNWFWSLVSAVWEYSFTTLPGWILNLSLPLQFAIAAVYLGFGWFLATRPELVTDSKSRVSNFLQRAMTFLFWPQAVLAGVFLAFLSIFYGVWMGLGVFALCLGTAVLIYEIPLRFVLSQIAKLI